MLGKVGESSHALDWLLGEGVREYRVFMELVPSCSDDEYLYDFAD